MEVIHLVQGAVKCTLACKPCTAVERGYPIIMSTPKVNYGSDHEHQRHKIALEEHHRSLVMPFGGAVCVHSCTMPGSVVWVWVPPAYVHELSVHP